MEGKIFVVDDNYTSLEFIKIILEEHGYKTYTELESKNSINKIIEFEPDLILLDIWMPQLNGFDVCKELKNNDWTKNIPVIFLSASNNTDEKVKGFQSGAIDYITKPFEKRELLARVNTQIQLANFKKEKESQSRELLNYSKQLEHEILERKKLERQLFQSNNLYRTTLYSIGDAVVTTDNRGKITLMNTVAENLTGWKFDEINENKITEILQIINQQTLEIYDDPIELVIKLDTVNGLAYHSTLISKNGTKYIISASASPIIDETGELKGTVIVFKDETEKHKSIQKIKSFNQIFEESLNEIYIFDAQTLKFIFANKEAINNIGFSMQELSNMTPIDIKPEYNINSFRAALKPLVKNEIETLIFETLHHRKKGTTYPVEIHLQKSTYDNKKVFIAFILDITERKQHEEKLKRSNHQYNMLIELAADAFLHGNSKGNIILSNSAATKLTGYSRSELEKMNIINLFSKSQINKKPLRYDLLKTTQSITFERELLRKDGEIVFIEMSSTKMPDGTYQSFFRNVDKRKKLELLLKKQNNEILKQNEEFQQLNKELDQSNRELFDAKVEVEKNEIRYRTVVSNTPMVSFVINNKGIFTLSEGKGLAKLGLKPGQAVGRSVFDVYKTFDTVISDLKYALKGNAICSETNINGIIFDITYTPVFDSEKLLIEVIGVANDITERKQAEKSILKAKEAAEESETRFKALHNASFGGIAIHDKGLILDCNMGLTEITQYSYDELIGMDGLLYIAEKSRNLVRSNIEIGYEKPYEAVGIRKNGKEYPVMLEARQIPYRGKMVRAVEFRDITEQKKVEKEILHHKIELQEYFENDISADYLVSTKGELFSCNKTFLDIFGFSERSHTEKLNITQLYKNTNDRKELIKQLKEHKKVKNYEVDFITQQGETINAIINAIGIFNEKNELQKIRVYVVDISALKAAETKLQKSETEYRYLFENNPLPMWIYDIDTLAFVVVNESAIDHYGYTRDEFLQMTLKDIHPKEDIPNLLSNVELDRKDQTDLGVHRHLLKNGELIYVNIISHSIHFENRKSRLVVANNITARITAEEGIQNERNLLRTLIDHIPDSIYIKDDQGRKIIANNADSKFFDPTKTPTIIGKTDLELIPGTIGENCYYDDMMVINTGKPIINKEEKFIIPNGDLRWLLTSKIPISNKKGEIYGLVGIGRDITELKKSNESILKLSIAIEQSPLSIIITNIKGEIEFTNPKFTEITGYSNIEAKGKNPRFLQSGGTPIETYKQLWKTIVSKKEWRGEFLNRKKNGELYWESATIAPIINEKGNIISYIAIKEDITFKKQMREKLINSMAKAEESDRLKSAFLANMSHEIRTPLNGILGFTELLVDPDFDQQQKDEMAILIIDNGDLLLSIINDVLDISKIEAGQIEIHKSVFKVDKLLSNIKNTFILKAKKEGIELKLRIQEQELKSLNSDFMKIKQVLTNLVSNAIKYTDKGTVEIGCTQEQSRIIFYVKDTGIGIDTDKLDKIFERFNRRDAYTKKVPGTGLGLAIAKSFVEMLGGKIWVESKIRKGSCFYFSIPN